MTRCLAALVAALTLVLLAAPAPASDRYPEECVEGYGPTGQGYYYHAGYWYRNRFGHGQAYTRYFTPTTYQARDAYGCLRTYTGYDCTYTPYTPPALPSVSSDDFASGLLGIIGSNQKAANDLQKIATKHAANTQLLELAVQHNLITPLQARSALPVANHYGISTYGAAYYAGAIPAGSTGYGYSTRTDLYGDTNLNALYAQAERLASGSVDAGKQAVAGHTALVAQAGANSRAVAEILAKGQVAVSVLQNARPEPSATVQTSSVSIGPAGQVMPKADDDTTVNANAVARPDLAALWQQDGCIKCHGGATPAGGFGFNKIAADPANVLARLNSADPKAVMPRGADGNGKPLPAERRAQWAVRLAELTTRK